MSKRCINLNVPAWLMNGFVKGKDNFKHSPIVFRNQIEPSSYSASINFKICFFIKNICDFVSKENFFQLQEKTNVSMFLVSENSTPSYFSWSIRLFKSNTPNKDVDFFDFCIPVPICRITEISLNSFKLEQCNLCSFDLTIYKDKSKSAKGLYFYPSSSQHGVYYNAQDIQFSGFKSSPFHVDLCFKMMKLSFPQVRSIQFHYNCIKNEAPNLI